jgi:hypothetical protein
MIAATSLLGLLFAAPSSPVAGISEELANERAAAISSLRYELSFGIPEKKTEPVGGTAKTQFELRAPHPIERGRATSFSPSAGRRRCSVDTGRRKRRPSYGIFSLPNRGCRNGCGGSS